MRKLPAVAMIVLTALALGSASPLLLQAQNRAAPGVVAANDDLPHRTAREFAPFMRAVLARRINAAQQIFKLRRGVAVTLESPETAQILNQFNKPDRLDLNLVGGRLLGQKTGIVFFTIASQDGPVGFKIYYYAYGEDVYVGRIEMADEWADIEEMAKSVDALSTPVTVSLGLVDARDG